MVVFVNTHPKIGQQIGQFSITALLIVIDETGLGFLGLLLVTSLGFRLNGLEVNLFIYLVEPEGSM